MSLKQQLLDNNYVVIDNFISKERAKYLSDWLENEKINNRLAQDSRFVLGLYARACLDAIPFVELLCEKINEVSSLIEEQVLPTYTYCILYENNSALIRHKDRPACEISVTVMIGSDKTPWPIFMDGTEINMEPGDAAIYLGCEIEHWREEFKGDWHAQTFLHYVDANGEYKEWAKDKRPIYGMHFQVKD